MNEMKIGIMENLLEICERVRLRGNKRTLMDKNCGNSRVWEVRALLENYVRLFSFKAGFATMTISNSKRNCFDSKLNENNVKIGKFMQFGGEEMHKILERFFLAQGERDNN